MDFDEVFIQNSDKSISHLGLVAGAFDELNIGTIIDNLIPKTGNHHLSHGDIVKSMILNGLGFVERRLYLFQDFFTDIAIERLIKEDIQLEYLNDDVIGRSLDAIDKFGPTELFNNIVAHSLKTQEFAVHLVNADTTNFSVHGNYDSDSNTEEIQITHGYPKDGRWDLKRFVLGLATNQCGVPLFMKTFSGNESDKTALLSVIQDVKKNLQNTDKVYHVADSAFYTDENLKTLGTHTFWISRVPLTLNEAQDLHRISQPFNISDDPRYSFYESTSNYADIPQKWIVFHSSEQQKKKETTFTKKLAQTELTTRKLFKKLLAKKFACEADALATATKWIEKKPFYQFSYLGVKTVTVKEERKRGRPRNDESVAIKYKIDAQIEVDRGCIDHERSLLGRFIIATNDLELNSETALSYYKKQSKVESGFRFLKDPSFRVSEVYLKRISRIRALTMIMVLCLFVYAITEYKLRQKLKEQNETIIAQTKKQTQKPTLKWVFFLFRRVREITLKIDGKLVTRVLNVDSTLEKIIRLLGRRYENYYFS